MLGITAIISVKMLRIFRFKTACSSSISTKGKLILVKGCCVISESSILLGPASLGLFSSRNAGISIMRINVVIPRKSISIVGVEFGVILTF